jgi:hypothetical protein
MRVDEIRKALRAGPFEPFVIRTSDGREYPVRHPEFLAIVYGGRAVVVADTDETYELIDVLHITSLHYGDGRPRRTPRKGAK